MGDLDKRAVASYFFLQMPHQQEKKPSPSSGTPAKSAWLSRDDWITAGQGLLLEDGIAGMRLTKLTQRLNVSTGSFYHHFTDMDDYLSALAEYFRVDQVSRLVAELKRDFPNPVARIRQLAIESLKSGLLALDAPMRVWAASDERAAQSLRKVEHIVLSFLKEAFEEAGFAKADAELRAHVLLSVSVARLLTPYAGGGLREQTLRILLTRPPA